MGLKPFKSIIQHQFKLLQIFSDWPQVICDKLVEKPNKFGIQKFRKLENNFIKTIDLIYK